MKRINRKDYERLEQLTSRLSLEFSDLTQQSTKIWRGDVRAIRWAAWWIRETIQEHAMTKLGCGAEEPK